MQAVLSNLMASLLLIQAVTGWCWHAPNDCANCAHSTVHRVARTCSCRDQCKPCEHSEGSPAPGGSKGKCHGFCTYVAAQETRIDMSQATVSFNMAAIVLTELDRQLTSAIAWERACHLAVSEPPLRLHLLHQLLLI